MEIRWVMSPRSPRRIDENCPSCSTSGSSTRRQAPVASEFARNLQSDQQRRPWLKSMSNFTDLVKLARDVARVQGQPAGKEEDSETSDENVSLLVPKFARAMSGRWTSPLAHACPSFVVSCVMQSWKNRSEAKSCESTRSATKSSNRSGQVPQVCQGARAPSGRRRRSRRCFGGVFERLLCPGSSASPWFTATRCFEDRVPSFSRFGSSKLPRFHR